MSCKNKELWEKQCNSNLTGYVIPMMELVWNSVNKGFIVLIDKYNHSQQHAFNIGFIDEAKLIIKAFYITLLKINVFLILMLSIAHLYISWTVGQLISHMGFCMSILLVAKSGLLLSLNNIKLITMLIIENWYSDLFGFTKDKVTKLYKRKNLSIIVELHISNTQSNYMCSSLETLESWYNSYVIGGKTIVFNLWIIFNSIS